MNGVVVPRVAVALVAGSLLANAEADFHFDARTSDYSVMFSDLSFSGAAFDGTVSTLCRPDAKADTFSGADFGFPTGLSLISWKGDADVAVQNVQDFGTHATADLYASTGQPGAMHIRFGGAASGNAGDFCAKYLLAGQNVLEVNASSGGFVDDHGMYYWGLTMPGDWSASGTSAGQHQLLALNSANWLVFSDFEYDSVRNTTYFGAVNTDYLNDGLHDIDVSIRLYGSVVPEPFSLATVAFGVLLVARRHRPRVS